MNLVTVDKIRAAADPLSGDQWGCDEITQQMIQTSISEGRVNTTSFDPYVDAWSIEQHVERIAYFVMNPREEPISLDVGIPGIGFNMHWIVTDGNHRLAAAIFKGQKKIRAEISGEVSYAKKLLGVSI